MHIIVLSFLTGMLSPMRKLHISTGSFAVSSVAYEFHMCLFTWILIMCIFMLISLVCFIDLVKSPTLAGTVIGRAVAS